MYPNCFIFHRESESRRSPAVRGGVGWGGGRSGGAMVLGKLAVSKRPTNLNNSRARAYCVCSRCGWGLFGHFSLVYPVSSLSPSLGDGPI